MTPSKPHFLSIGRFNKVLPIRVTEPPLFVGITIYSRNLTEDRDEPNAMFVQRERMSEMTHMRVGTGKGKIAGKYPNGAHGLPAYKYEVSDWMFVRESSPTRRLRIRLSRQ